MGDFDTQKLTNWDSLDDEPSWDILEDIPSFIDNYDLTQLLRHSPTVKGFEESADWIVFGIVTSNIRRGDFSDGIPYNSLSFEEKVDIWERRGQGQREGMETHEKWAALYQKWMGSLVIQFYPLIGGGRGGILNDGELIFICPSDSGIHGKHAADFLTSKRKKFDKEAVIMDQEKYFERLWNERDEKGWFRNRAGMRRILRDNVSQWLWFTPREGGPQVEIEYVHGLFIKPEKKQRGQERHYYYFHKTGIQIPEGDIPFKPDLDPGDFNVTRLSKKRSALNQSKAKEIIEATLGKLLEPGNLSKYVDSYQAKVIYPPYQDDNGNRSASHEWGTLNQVQSLGIELGGGTFFFSSSMPYLFDGEHDAARFEDFAYNERNEGVLNKGKPLYLKDAANIPHKFSEEIQYLYKKFALQGREYASSTNRVTRGYHKQQKLSPEFQGAADKLNEQARQVAETVSGSQLPKTRKNSVVEYSCKDPSSGRIRAFQRRETSGEGNCLFASVAASLNGDVYPNDPYDLTAIRLRWSVCDYFKHTGWLGPITPGFDDWDEDLIIGKLKDRFNESPFEKDRFMRYMRNVKIHPSSDSRLDEGPPRGDGRIRQYFLGLLDDEDLSHYTAYFDQPPPHYDLSILKEVVGGKTIRQHIVEAYADTIETMVLPQELLPTFRKALNEGRRVELDVNDKDLIAKLNRDNRGSTFVYGNEIELNVLPDALLEDGIELKRGTGQVNFDVTICLVKEFVYDCIYKFPSLPSNYAVGAKKVFAPIYHEGQHYSALTETGTFKGGVFESKDRDLQHPERDIYSRYSDDDSGAGTSAGRQSLFSIIEKHGWGWK